MLDFWSFHVCVKVTIGCSKAENKEEFEKKMDLPTTLHYCTEKIPKHSLQIKCARNVLLGSKVWAQS